MKKVVVIGASSNPERYSYKAIHLLKAYGHDVVGIGLNAGKVADVEIKNEFENFNDVDAVTLYVGQKNQSFYYDYILSLQPKRVIFNPGAENEEFENILRQNNINTENACTLVLLSTGQF